MALKIGRFASEDSLPCEPGFRLAADQVDHVALHEADVERMHAPGRRRAEALEHHAEQARGRTRLDMDTEDGALRVGDAFGGELARELDIRRILGRREGGLGQIGLERAAAASDCRRVDAERCCTGGRRAEETRPLIRVGKARPGDDATGLVGGGASFYRVEALRVKIRISGEISRDQQFLRGPKWRKS